MKIVKGDTIKLIKGKDRGKTGKVLKVIPSDDRILAEGLNMYKKHVRPKKQGEKGETVIIPRPFNAANAMVVCSNCDKPTRIGYAIENGKKQRICKKCKARI